MTPYEILVNSNNFIVVGVTDDQKRFSHKIYKLLQGKGKRVFGINPRMERLDEDIIYPDIPSVSEPIDVCVMVVNPAIGVTYLDDIAAKGIKYLWLQPGTFDDTLIETAKSKGLEVVDACVLAEYGKHESK